MPNQQGYSYWRSPGFAIGASLALMLLAIGASVLVFARVQDSDQTVSEQRIVESAINDAMAKLGDALRPNTYWDDAYNHITSHIDPVWAEKNLGPYAQDTSGVSAVVIVNGAGKAFYHYLGPDPHGRVTDYSGDAAVMRLVTDARTRTTVPPTIATGFVGINHRVYLGASSLIIPNDDRAKAPLKFHNVEVYLQAFGAESIAKVQRDFHVSAVTLSDKAPPKGAAMVPLRDAAGRTVGYLWWHAATPGSDFARSLAPFVIVIVVVIGLLQWSAIRRHSAVLRELDRTEMEAIALRQESLAKSAFIGTISHELRTPLNAILGFSDVLMRQLFGPLGAPQYEDYANHIHDSGKTLLQRINDVIEFSRIEGGDKELGIAKIDCRLALQDAIAGAAAKAAARNIHIVCREAEDSILVNSCGAALQEILSRVLDNAVKFSCSGSRVEIDVVAADSVNIQIRDAGIGIEPDILDLLGKPFAQGEGHLTRAHDGLGLGLAICYGLAGMLKIAIDVESESGIGTVVTVRIPGRLDVPQPPAVSRAA